MSAAPELEPVIDRTGEMLAAILHEANQVGAVHGIHAIGDTVIITAATANDVNEIANRLLNGHHGSHGHTVGTVEEGEYVMRNLLTGETRTFHVRIVRDVLQ